MTSPREDVFAEQEKGSKICEKIRKKHKEMPVAKLKTIMDKCKTLYFICKSCNENFPEGSDTNNETEKLRIQCKKADGRDLVETFEDTLNHQKIEQLESKIESIIESKLGEKMNTLITFNKSIQEQCDTLNKASVSYSASVQVTSVSAGAQSLDFRQIMRETKHEELVQQQEREVRSKNIINHGCSEAPVIQESKAEDNYFVKELFRIMGVEAIPASTIRIGKRSDTRPRPIKIVMSNQNEKEMVMNNLGKLKNAVEKFKRISVTDDYTAEERDAIKNKVTEARKKTDAEGEGVYVWKVRGSPKNGLRLIRFTKSRPQEEIPNQQ